MPTTPVYAHADDAPVTPGASVSPEAAALVARLSSTDFAERQAATERLMGDESISLAALEAMIARNDLTPEARARLLQAARQAFYKSPRAALGVQFDRVLRDRVVVGRTFEKFPAHKTLEPGDIIIEADGVPLRGPMGQLVLPAIIVSYDPGQTMSLVVRRGEKRLSIQAPLGNFSDLDQAGFLADDRLSRAWRVRAARILASARGPADAQASAPIRVDAPAGAWGLGGLDSALRINGELIVRPLREAQEGVPQVAGGGMPRLAMAIEDDQRMVSQLIMVGGRQQIIQVPRARQFVDEIESLGPSMTPQQELLEINRQRAGLAAEAARLRGIEDLPLTDPSRMRAEETLRTIRSLERQAAAIQAEINEAAAQGVPGAVSAPTEPGKD
jgi:hypothetical protein